MPDYSSPNEELLEAIAEAIPHLSGEDLLEVISTIAHEYVVRYGGSPESVLSSMKAVVVGAESGYTGAIGLERRQLEDG